jgi:HNH endonuclease
MAVKKRSAGPSSKAAKRAPKPRLKKEVCKPCWELKYCPYGPLVEQFPLHPEFGSLADIKRLHRRVKAELSDGKRKSHQAWWELIERFQYSSPRRWEWISQYQTEELGCNVFGHICPVFFTAEPFTETKAGRRIGRSIPRDIMLKVVRRDGQICQSCHQPVRDDEVEFDHVIPFSMGGPMTAENLRLSCRRCNREKSDSLDELLWQRNQPGENNEK